MNRTKHSVLVVDDDAINIAILVNVLESEYTVYAENNGPDAIKTAETYLPDVILLDVIMPGMNGYAVIAELKQNEKTRDIPVIFATGLHDRGEEEKGLALGAADYIVKPYSPAIVKLRVKNLISSLVQLQAIEYDIMKYKLTSDALNIALWDMDIVDGDPINSNNRFMWSPEFRRMLGFTDESDFPNQLSSWSDCLHPNDREPTLEAFAAHINDRSGETPYNVEYHLKTKDGEYRFFQAFGTTLRGNGGVPLRVAGALMDITEKEQSAERIRHAYTKLRDTTEKVREAEEISKAKNNFIAMMSHEIRTPMNSIVGFAELALAQTSELHVRTHLDKIINGTKLLLHIINDILDISKIESGKILLEHTPFNLQDIISHCQAIISPSVSEKGLDLKVCASSPPNKKLLGDPVRLYQALINLLSNAVKFTTEGVITLAASIKETKGCKTTMCFEVKDSGIGMTPEQVKNVFGSFTQASFSTTRKYGGAGLGLTITKNIVELMGGKLSVETTSGAGCTFSFEVAFDTIDVNETDAAHTKPSIVEKPYFNGLILICDDNPMNRNVMCEHLANVGLSAVTTENGKLGVEAVQKRIEQGKKPFDLILMDIFMPVMDGMEAAGEIIKLNTGTPVVAVTANVMAGELEKYRECGMPDCLGKPFTSQELWHTLLKYLVPVSSSVVDERIYAKEGDDLREKMKLDFIKNNQNAYDNIVKAIAENDVTLAHRLAHTLKGNAGQIGQTKLQQAAAAIEGQLKYGSPLVPENDMDTLKTEFAAVIKELKPLLDNKPKPSPALSAEQALLLFEKLEPMLENINPECVNLLDDIRTVFGTEELVHCIENYDFESATLALAKLWKKERINNE